MEIKHLLVWIVCGAIAGLGAEFFAPARTVSRLLTFILRGILGGVAGGLIGYILFSGDASRPSSVMTSLVGAVLAVVALLALQRRSIE